MGCKRAGSMDYTSAAGSMDHTLAVDSTDYTLAAGSTGHTLDNNKDFEPDNNLAADKLVVRYKGYLGH
ncbi:hypothetical protein [Neobacillus novalis]|nr:hypothetical protein [Neobacillus novalis]